MCVWLGFDPVHVMQDIVREFGTQYILCVEYSIRIYSNMIYVPLFYIELNFLEGKVKDFLILHFAQALLHKYFSFAKFCLRVSFN